MKNTVIASLGAAMLVAAANAAVIVNQPNDTGNGYTSQDFTDFPAYSGSCFDDFTLSGQTQLGALTVFGQDGAGGNSGANVAVVARIFLSPDLTSGAVATVVGTQVGGDLVGSSHRWDVLADPQGGSFVMLTGGADYNRAGWITRALMVRDPWLMAGFAGSWKIVWLRHLLRGL